MRPMSPFRSGEKEKVWVVTSASWTAIDGLGEQTSPAGRKATFP